jgi:hypothetical protein
MPGRGEFGFKTLELACKHEPDSSALSCRILVERARSNRLQHLRPLVPMILAAMLLIAPGQVRIVGR